VVIQTIIADDEVLARQKLRTLLDSEPELEIVGEASSPSEILAQVRSKNPQLLFLDICMPSMNGFDVIGELSKNRSTPLPHIIVTTAYDQYAVRAFEMHAVDYLLKPFTAERLRSALQHVREKIQNGGTGARDGKTGEAALNRIVFKSRGRILFLPVSEIRWIAAEENYIRICTGTENHLLRETMTNIENKLDSKTFLRVHRSAIVNLRYVKEVRREGQSEFSVLLSNGQKVAMSRSYHSRIDNVITHL
jgi:two-component system LytT family response regulator